MIRSVRQIFLIGLAVVGWHSVGQAAVINPIGATSTMGSGFETLLSNTINGAGLQTYPSLTANHLGTLPNNSWVSSQGVLSGSIDFQLGGLFQIDGFSFWNQNGGGPGTLGSTGIQNVSVLASLDGSSFLSIPGSPSVFAQVTGNTALPPQIFTFAPVLARYVRLNVTSNYGDTGQTGFAEIAFSGSSATVIPEPVSATIWWMGLTVIAASVNHRRDRRENS